MVAKFEFDDTKLKGLCFKKKVLAVRANGTVVFEEAGEQRHNDWSVRDTRQTGLTLRLSPGSKTWCVIATLNGSTVRRAIASFQTLGSNGKWSDGMGTVDARKHAKAYIGLMARGIDPLAEKRREGKEQRVEQALRQTTLKVAFAEYHEAKKNKNKPTTVKDRAQVPGWMEGSALWSTPVVDIDKAAVKAALQPLIDVCFNARAKRPTWGPKSIGPGSVSKIFTYTSAAYRRAVDELKLNVGEGPFVAYRKETAWPQARPRETYLQTGTAEGQAWLRALVALQQRAHDPEVLEQRADPRSQVLKPHVSVLVDFFVCVLLFGTRKLETAKVRWEDVKFRERLVIFRETKSGKDGVVPLTPWSTEILQARRESNRLWRPERETPWVFPSRHHGKSLNNPRRVLTTLLEETGVFITAHDLRRTLATDFATLEYAQADVGRLLMVGAALNHQRGRTGSVVAASTPQYIQAQADIARPRYQEREDKLRKIVGLPLLSPAPASTGEPIGDASLDALIERAKTDPELKRRLMERMLS